MALAAAPVPQSQYLIDLLKQKVPPYDRAVEMYRRLIAINELATSMNGASNVEQLQHCLARTFAELMPDDSVRLCVADETAYRRLRLSGPDLGFEESSLPLSHGLIGEVLRTGAPLWLCDGVQMEGIPACGRTTPMTPGTVMCLPFTGLGKVMGALELVSDQADRFDEFNYHLLLLVAAHLSSSLENVLTRQELAAANAHLRERDQRLTELNGQLQLLAQTDDTTGLFNKRRLLEQLDAEIARARRYGEILSCLMIDIDDFKVVNDTHGHRAGDEALRGIGTLLKQALRRTDFVARFGGEEFTILLPRTDRAGAQRVAEAICSRIRSHNLVTSATVLRLTVSIGIACCTKFDHLDAQQVIQHADGALYRAKHLGKDRACLSEENVATLSQ